MLNSAFRYVEPSADAYKGFLMNASGRAKETLHREPFRPEEVAAAVLFLVSDEARHVTGADLPVDDGFALS